MALTLLFGVKQHNSSAQYTIVHDGQTDTSTQDQSKTGNQWVLLGSYTFTGSGSEYIELSDSGGKTAADGIRLVEQAGSGGPTYGEVWYAIHNDHLGTPQFMTDLNQQIAWSQSHSAFGEATIDEDPDGDGTVITYNQRFPGQYFDGESGLHYNYFRDYDPGTGRYVQSDPIGLIGGLNTYGYVLQNPLRYTDFNGNAPKPPNTGKSGKPVAVDPSTGEVIDYNNPKGPKTTETIGQPKPKDPLLNKKKPGKGCMSAYNFCRAACIARCPGGWIGKGVCLSGCFGIYIACVSAGGEAGG